MGNFNPVRAVGRITKSIFRNPARSIMQVAAYSTGNPWLVGAGFGVAHKIDNPHSDWGDAFKTGVMAGVTHYASGQIFNKLAGQGIANRILGSGIGHTIGNTLGRGGIALGMNAILQAAAHGNYGRVAQSPKQAAQDMSAYLEQIEHLRKQANVNRITNVAHDKALSHAIADSALMSNVAKVAASEGRPATAPKNLTQAHQIEHRAPHVSQLERLNQRSPRDYTLPKTRIRRPNAR